MKDVKLSEPKKHPDRLDILCSLDVAYIQWGLPTYLPTNLPTYLVEQVLHTLRQAASINYITLG